MSGRPSSRSAVAPRVGRALVVVVGLAVLVALGPVLSRPLTGPPAGSERSSAFVAAGADTAVVAAPQPRSPGPLLLPLILALVGGLLALRGRRRPTGGASRSSAHAAGLDRWRARLVGAPPSVAFVASH
jgi:hypothetical protein